MKRRLSRYLRVAERVGKALGPDDCLLAGGLAVAVHGFVRGTRDVDLVTRLPLGAARARLTSAGLVTSVRRGDAFEGGFACLQGESEGLPFDVLPQLVPIHWDRAEPVGSGGALTLRAVGLEDLLALKLKAQGPKDLMDVAILVLLHPRSAPRARELASAYRATERFETWLRDPRIRAQARAEARAEAGRRPRSSRRRSRPTS